jgi:hypothetical protein
LRLDLSDRLFSMPIFKQSLSDNTFWALADDIVRSKEKVNSNFFILC